MAQAPQLAEAARAEHVEEGIERNGTPILHARANHRLEHVQALCHEVSIGAIADNDASLS
jgi:hypothetical protein